LETVLVRIMSKNLESAEEVLEVLKQHYSLVVETGRKYNNDGPYRGFYRLYASIAKEVKAK